MELNIIHFVILISTAVVLGLFLNLLLKKRPAVSGNRKTGNITETRKKPMPCPLCGSQLSRTEKVKSVVYPGKEDKLVEIFGCPYCIPPGEQQRRCPVCKKILGSNDYVLGRMFDTPEKTHIHVNGCTLCMKRH